MYTANKDNFTTMARNLARVDPMTRTNGLVSAAVKALDAAQEDLYTAIKAVDAARSLREPFATVNALHRHMLDCERKVHACEDAVRVAQRA